MSILANKNAIGGGNYLIERSLRFQSASSQNLTRTPASTTNRRTWTLSFWMKRGALGTIQGVFCGNNTTTNGQSITFFNLETDDRLHLQSGVLGTSNAFWLKTTAVFRDSSAWYHIVLKFDSTQATASDRVVIYINGVSTPLELDNTSGNTVVYPPLNYDTVVNTTNTGGIGVSQGSTAGLKYFDGYMAEVNFIDGQALTPSSFGETDATTGVWVAKKYAGTYGTNGFYLKFNDGTSTTTLGQDRSGNANNWTLTNFTRSAGVSDCWMLDVPSGNGSPSATQPSSNYPVMNPLAVFSGATAFTYAAGNLNVDSGNVSTFAYSIATMNTGSSGKYYFEATVNTSTTSDIYIGVINESQLSTTIGTLTTLGSYRNLNTIVNLNGVVQTAGASYTTGDVIGVAIDVDAGTVQFYKNNVAQGATPSFTFTAGTPLFPKISSDNNAGAIALSANFGQRSFAYTPPSGFKALCTANMPAPTIAKGNQYMDATAYSGNSTIQNVTNVAGFSPDLVWIKSRSGATDHILNDTVRGAGNYLISNLTNAEATNTTIFSAFNSNGFQVNNASQTNSTGSTYVAWQWDAGSSTVTNTSGSISSQVRANTTAGFSVVTYTGTGANATVGHGLGVAPKMVIVKTRSLSTENWNCWHTSLNNTAARILLNTTAAVDTASPTIWGTGGINPTSTTFQVGTNAGTNQSSATYVAYVFSEIAGFSKIGSYTGNGSADGPFVYCGFRPKFVMIKRTDVADNWEMRDTSRDTYNVQISRLRADLSAAEVTTSGEIDITSNGFKLRNINSAYNTSAGTYIFMAFAENPFNYSNAR